MKINSTQRYRDILETLKNYEEKLDVELQHLHKKLAEVKRKIMFYTLRISKNSLGKIN